VPKSVRRLAFLKAFSARVIAGDILVTDEIKVSKPKTKEFVSLVKSHSDAEKILLISTGFDQATYKAARNVKPVRLSTASEVNTEQLLAFEKIIVTSGALAKLAERLA
jgi:large subunit ribosomal protein L4